jgi:hypothetical protein
MTNDKDSEDALTIAYLLGVKHGRAEQNTQTDALKIAREALENAPIIGLTESAVDFRKRQDLWAYGQWKAAIKALKEIK